jgi:glycosyltransferase 2 family protein
VSITPIQTGVGPIPRQDAPTANMKRLALVAIKAIVSIGLIAVLATRLDYARVLSYWRLLNGVWILGALGILFLEMCLLAGVRLKLMLVSVDARRPLTTTAHIALCGFFFEQVTIGFVGGDAIRLWLLRRTHVPFGRAIQALLLDRACGFASLVLLSLIGVQALLPLVEESVREVITVTLGAFVAAGFLGIAVIVVLTKVLPPTKLSAYWQRFGLSEHPLSMATLAIVFILAVATQLLNVLVFWMLGQSLGLPTALQQWFIVAPTVLLVSMLPISIGGWGVREGAMVVALHGFGISAEDALLPSVLFGLCAVLATLPGGILWVINRDAVVKSAGIMKMR